MSLIPSESYTFPDHFIKTVTASRKPKNPEPEPVRTQKTSRIVPMPAPRAEPKAENPERVAQPAHDVAPRPLPNPALRRASAPPPRIPDATVGKQTFPTVLKPAANAATRAPAMEPGPLTEISAPELDAPEITAPPPPKTPAPIRKVIQMPVAPVVPVSPAALQRTAPPPPIPKRKPQPIVTTSQPDFFELFAQNADSTLAARRRKMKMRRFVFCESLAVAILLPLAAIGIMRQPSNVILVWLLNISTIAAAFAAALIPILFYAATPTLPEIDR